MQVLSQFESSFRRASHKSGCEFVFPMQFGHMAFVTHRCWTVFLRKAQFLALDAWRIAYGQLAIQPDHSDTAVTYRLPDGKSFGMKGWSEGVRRKTKPFAVVPLRAGAGLG